MYNPLADQSSSSTSTSIALPLLTRRNQLALRASLRTPATGKRRATNLRSVLRHPRLELGTEVADQALDGPGESLAES